MSKAREIINYLEERSKLLSFINSSFNDILTELKQENQKENLRIIIPDNSYSPNRENKEFIINLDGINIIINFRDVENKVKGKECTKGLVKSVIEEMIIQQIKN